MERLSAQFESSRMTRGASLTPEDERIVTTLAKFASAAWQLWTARPPKPRSGNWKRSPWSSRRYMNIGVGQMIALEKEVERLRKENVRLKTHVNCAHL
jgi:hypothetical protein